VTYDLTRLGLDESLEAYSKRLGCTPDEARYAWRVESLRLLHVANWTPEGVPTFLLIHVTRGLCRIAPGVSVPTREVVWSDP